MNEKANKTHTEGEATYPFCTATVSLNLSEPITVHEADSRITYMMPMLARRWAMDRLGGCFGDIWRQLHSMVDELMLKTAKEFGPLRNSEGITMEMKHTPVLTVANPLYGNPISRDLFIRIIQQWQAMCGSKPKNIVLSRRGYELCASTEWWRSWHWSWENELRINPTPIMNIPVIVDASLPNSILFQLR